MLVPKHLFAFVVLFLVMMTMKPAACESITGDGNGGVGCIERERQALVEIKDELTDNYGHLSSWSGADDKRDCCKWRGITCSNHTNHVTKLDLRTPTCHNRKEDLLAIIQSYRGLRGKMSSSLLKLRHLTHLDLSCNDFRGTHFPYNNGSFTSLLYLNLSYANFGGAISSMVQNLSRLQSLDLSYNYFHDIGNVEWLFGLPSLRYLDLSFNQLIRPTDWFQIPNKLLHLQILNLRFCFSSDDEIPLTHPSPLNASSSLTTLDLSGNSLVISAIYPWLSNITHNIIQLRLSFNNLQGLNVAVFGNMVSLERLALSNTRLAGGLTKLFGNMSRLKYLDLSDNNLGMQLFDLIRNLSGCAQKSLQYVYLHNNQLTGSLPNLTGFSSLRRLLLFQNRLNGTIDKSIGQLSKLESLVLGSNSLTGTISEDHFSNLSNLKDLGLSGNSFIWNMSPDWVPPFHLRTINVGSCKMGPHFPKWLQTQKNYTRLDISDAGISDSIPIWFWNLSSEIYHLNLSHNNLRGPVLSLPLMFTAFPFIDISFKHFDGPLPLPQLSSNGMSSETGEAFYSNNSSDKIAGPTVYLDFSNNLFSGVIPDGLMHLQDLVYVSLGSNNLSGEIPTSIGLLWKLETLNLENNVLSGELPLSLKNCTRLRFLDLSYNRLTGNIPTWIGENLLSLQFLRLKSNQFQGSIPLQMCQLTYAQILDLSLNNINGTISHCLKNLKAMTDGYSTESIRHDYLLVENGFILYYLGVVSFYVDRALLLWKGRMYLCNKNLGWFRIIDLSSNKLEGEIPRELANLLQLQQLNLSNNRLTGTIPQEIGNMKQLESLDLSRNQLSGKLPDGMASLNFLNTLNLSFNNLCGRIPSSTQLQSFNASIFIGNQGLCGLPLTHNCPEDNTVQVPEPVIDSDQEDSDKFWKCFYIAMAVGFVVAFWGVLGALLLKSSWRRVHFQLIDKSTDWIYVTIAVNWRRLEGDFERRIHHVI